MASSKNSMSQSVYNAFEIVNFLAGRGWCRIKDISDAFGFDRAKIHRILTSMEALNYIEYDLATRRYRLGQAFFSVSYHMEKGESVISMIRQPMEWLAHKTGENVNFCMLSSVDHSKVVNIYKISSNLSLAGIDEETGISDAIFATAVGKCLLAYLPMNEQSEIVEKLPYKKYTKNTLTDPDSLLNELHAICEQGFALDNQEFSEKMSCIAMPIFTQAGSIYAAISISSSKALEPRVRHYYKLLLTETIQKMKFSV